MQILAKGNSMYPTLMNGEKYEVEPIDQQSVREGDIIVFFAYGEVICHRVIKKITTKSGKIYLKTKGDNCNDADAYAISTDMLIGKVSQ